ncbi:MAG: glycosyltransferase [Streptococcaceae bacterium]|jgi:rhamnosyltransferase|nr:glycosyltransferase [Streptococcaceae bacterium]
MQERILAGIVTYNPDMTTLKEGIKAILPQVGKLLIVENASDNQNEILEMLSDFPTIEKIICAENAGIARALNEIGDFAVRESFDFFLTLDQDSVVIPDLLTRYEPYLHTENLGLLNSRYNERTLQYGDIGTSEIVIDSPYMVTAGAVMPVLVFKKFRYDEFLFIDKVDFDMSFRLLKAHYKLYSLPFYGLTQSIGDVKIIHFPLRKLYAWNYSPTRIYYMARNGVVFYKKHGSNDMSRGFLKSDFRVMLKGVLLERQKLKKINAYVRGIFAGLRYKETGK